MNWRKEKEVGTTLIGEWFSFRLGVPPSLNKSKEKYAEFS